MIIAQVVLVVMVLLAVLETFSDLIPRKELIKARCEVCGCAHRNKGTMCRRCTAWAEGIINAPRQIVGTSIEGAVYKYMSQPEPRPKNEFWDYDYAQMVMIMGVGASPTTSNTQRTRISYC